MSYLPRRWAGAAAAAAVMIAGTGVAFAQASVPGLAADSSPAANSSPADASAPTTDAFVVSVERSRYDVALGQMLTLQVKITNRTKQPVTVNPIVRWTYGGGYLRALPWSGCTTAAELTCNSVTVPGRKSVTVPVATMADAVVPGAVTPLTIIGQDASTGAVATTSAELATSGLASEVAVDPARTNGTLLVAMSRLAPGTRYFLEVGDKVTYSGHAVVPYGEPQIGSGLFQVRLSLPACVRQGKVRVRLLGVAQATGDVVVAETTARIGEPSVGGDSAPVATGSSPQTGGLPPITSC